MHTEQSLQTLKLGELKALCKDLRIASYSKLNKASLIEKILEGHNQDPPPNVPVNITDMTKTKTKQDAPVQTDEVRSQYSPPASKNRHQGKRPASNPADSALSPSKKKSKNKKTPVGAREHHEVNAIAQHNGSVLANNADSTVVPPAVGAAQDAISPKLAEPPSTDRDPESTSNMIAAAIDNTDTARMLPVVAKTSTKNRSPTKSPHDSKLSTLVRVKRTTVTSPFKPPQPIKRPAIPQNLIAARPATNTHTPGQDLMTSSQRISYVRESWINNLFLHLNGTRIIPITEPPFPSPISSSNEGPTRNLAFQSIHPDLYEKADPRVFEVVLRFWISRLYTLTYLGNGEAWSVLGGGKGMIGPDLAKWDTIMSAEKVSREVWLIVTESVHQQVDTAADGRGLSSQAKYLVLGLNGEVLASDHGQIPRPVQESHDKGTLRMHCCPVRADWQALMILKLDGQSFLESDLLKHVKTKNNSEYPQGISTTWQERMQRQDSPASAELIDIARRSVLSSCAANSFSGEKLSATAMDAEQLGHAIPTGGAPSARLELYLPE
ncbi:hypothetical protein IAU59_002911 [Kwoniella sp. CBS 9459]